MASILEQADFRAIIITLANGGEWPIHIKYNGLSNYPNTSFIERWGNLRCVEVQPLMTPSPDGAQSRLGLMDMDDPDCVEPSKIRIQETVDQVLDVFRRAGFEIPRELDRQSDWSAKLDRVRHRLGLF